MNAPARARRAAEFAAREWKLSIGGELMAAAGGNTYRDESPYSHRVIAAVPDGAPSDGARAARRAAEAAPAWGKLTPLQRAEHLRRLADELERHREELALLDVLDAGAPLGDMLRDVDRGLARLRMFADLGWQLSGVTIPSTSDLHYTVREPYGVTLRIIPFNHPAMFALSRIAAPLVAGNTVLLKPSELTPLSALRIGELAADVLPPGVLSVLVGQGSALPRALVRDPAVRRIGFIGSEPVGRAVQSDAADVGVKTVTLELGGKNALVACPDADPEEVADAAVRGMNIGWAGQSCGSTSRLLVHRDLAPRVVDGVVARMEALEIRSPFDDDCRMGTLVNRAQFDTVMDYVRLAAEEGATIACGGHPASHSGTGYYVRPVVLTGVTPSMRVANEEIFGPVLSVITWDDLDEAIRIANGVDYGLTASIWTRDVAVAHRLARRVEAGFVWVNEVSSHFPNVPFGGMKSSGIGRDEGIEELLGYTQLKAVNVKL